ncbi:MAG TPA: hypothetical protein VIY49_08115 [Bryobacteraceae bacterium]
MGADNDMLRNIFTKMGIELWREWWGDEEKDREKVRRAIARFLLQRAIDSATRRERSYSDTVKHIRSLPEFENAPAKGLLLGLLPFGVDTPLLKESKDLIGLEWTAENFSAIGEYKPERRKDFRGISIVLSFTYPKWFLAATRSFLEPVQEMINETTQHHITVLSISPKIPKAEAYSFRRKFVRRWFKAKREDRRLEGAIRHAERAAKIRIDELSLQRDGAIVMFASTSGGFMRSITELRLMLLGGLFQDLELQNRNWADYRQPIWGQTVFARKKAQVPDPVLNACRPGVPRVFASVCFLRMRDYR